MMTYRALKKFIKENTQSNNKAVFDLISLDIKSKIMFVVGDNASNTATFLTSIMNECEISYSHYINNKDIDINKRFWLGSAPISIELLCENAETILKSAKKMLSSDDLFFSLALSLSDCEYSIIEMSEQYYNHVKDWISPYAIIIAIKDDIKAKRIIENAPKNTKEIISLSQKDDFDYISSKTNKNGARITLASPNKITVSSADLLGISFYHYSYLYHISALDLNNVSLAHLSIETANVLLNAPRPYIYKGLETAKMPCDLVLYSLSPAILLREGKNNFKLHHRLKFQTVNENDKFEYPTQNTIFCGSKEYIEQIKEKLKKR